MIPHKKKLNFAQKGVGKKTFWEKLGFTIEICFFIVQHFCNTNITKKI
jgi:hypothetical protein